MNIGVFEDAGYVRLLPLTWLRPACELRCGRDLLIDKVRTHVGPVARFWVRETLRDVMAERSSPAAPDDGQNWCVLNSRALITGNLTPPAAGVAWRHNGALVAASVSVDQLAHLTPETFLNEQALNGWLQGLRSEPPPAAIRLIEYPWELALANGDELKRQCRDGGVCEGRVYPGAHLLNTSDIHIAAGAVVKPGAVLDAEHGPIHIGRNSLIQPNAVLEGPCCIGDECIVRPGANIRENTTIGPVSRVGGEISYSIFHGYSNKQHDGFLGHSYVAPWVNLGADTVTSNLKNTYGTIRVNINGVGVETGQHFVGSIIGDHAKTGIGTNLPTGCVVGVASNVFTRSVVPKFVPSFAWVTESGMTPYRIEKATHIAGIVMSRRDVFLSEAEKKLLEQTAALARQVEAAGWTS